MTIKPGDTVQTFEGLATDGEDVFGFDLEEVLGEGPIVIGFFPFAFTGGCEQQMCDLRDNLAELEQAGTRAFGVSADSPFALKVWHQDNGFGFPLVSDYNREGIEAFGVADDTILGLKAHAKRSAFVIDEDGQVVWAWSTDDPSVVPEIEEIQSVVAKLS